MEQVGGHVFADAATDQFHRAAEGFALAQVPHDVEVAGAAGLVEIELVGAIGRLQQVEFQAGGAHIAAHRSVAAGIHHQTLQRSIGLDPQVDPPMADLHRTSQKQSRRHGPAQQGGGEKRQAMAPAGVAGGHRAVHRHQADAASGGGGSDQLIGHRNGPAAGPNWSHRMQGAGARWPVFTSRPGFGSGRAGPVGGGSKRPGPGPWARVCHGQGRWIGVRCAPAPLPSAPAQRPCPAPKPGARLPLARSICGGWGGVGDLDGLS